MPLRLKLLVVAHVLLSVLGIAQFRLLIDTLWLPASTALSSLAIAQSMLVGLWIGLGTGPAWERGLGWIVSSLYLAMWPALAIHWLPPDTVADDASFLNGFVPAAVLFAGMTALFAAIFFLLRWRIALLAAAQQADLRIRPPQFGIIHVLVGTTALSLVLASSRAALTTEVNSPWHTFALYALLLTTFVAIVVAVPWALLSPGRIGWRTLVVLACSLAAGTAVSFVFYYGMQAREAWHWWWIFAGQAVAIGFVPTLVLVASLIVVRSCGYRLVGRRTLAAGEPLQFTPAPLNSRTANEG